MPDSIRLLECPLNDEQSVLWQKLTDFPLNSDSAAHSFSNRLAFENGWSSQFSERVIFEYRRFLFLTAVAGHVVCPSDEVDVAWHLHMLYSRQYWTDLCQRTLGFPLHHDPTSGGPAECRKHWSMYRKTLASYRRIFGEDAPREIWPLPFDRFDPSSQPRTVNLRDHWVIRKPGWWPRRVRGRVAISASILPFAATGLGPLDWQGPLFLTLFFGMFAVIFVASIIFRRFQCDVEVPEYAELEADEIACLNFGRAAAVNATIAGMLKEKELSSVPSKTFFGITNGSKVKFVPGEVAPPELSALANGIYQAVQAQPMTLAELQTAMKTETEAISEKLTTVGYLLDSSRGKSARFAPALAMLVLLLFGLTKMVIGIYRDRPVGILVSGCVFAFVVMTIFLAPVRRTLAGDRLLKGLANQNADLKSRLKLPASARHDVVLGAALFGAVALQDSIFNDFKSAWKTTAGSGSAGGGCGGGGCGGGGCGGGGCGGCAGG